MHCLEIQANSIRIQQMGLHTVLSNVISFAPYQKYPAKQMTTTKTSIPQANVVVQTHLNMQMWLWHIQTHQNTINITLPNQSNKNKNKKRGLPQMNRIIIEKTHDKKIKLKKRPPNSMGTYRESKDDNFLLLKRQNQEIDHIQSVRKRKRKRL